MRHTQRGSPRPGGRRPPRVLTGTLLVLLLALLPLASPAGAQTAAPAITSGTTFTVRETTTAVGTLTATDTDTALAHLTWAIPAGAAGGVDGAQFTLTAAGVLSFTTAPDYGTPTDTDEDNIYIVTVQVSDGDNTDTANLEVTVSLFGQGTDSDGEPSYTARVVTLHGAEFLNLTSVPPDPNAIRDLERLE